MQVKRKIISQLLELLDELRGIDFNKFKTVCQTQYVFSL